MYHRRYCPHRINTDTQASERKRLAQDHSAGSQRAGFTRSSDSGGIGASEHAWSRSALSDEEPKLGEVSDHSGPGQWEVYLNWESFTGGLRDR